MRYRVAFAKRVQSDGEPSAMRPSAELDVNLAEGIVVEKTFVAELETEAQHSQEVLDEDDAFLGSAAPELWDYEVVDERASEFEDAIQKSDLVLEFEVIDDTITTADEAPSPALSESGVYPADGGNEGVDVTAGGSGVRSGDDGPAGMPTGTKVAAAESAGIGDLNVMRASDPRLGLTNRGEKPAEDWAADTGSAQNPNPDAAVEKQYRPRRRQKTKS